MTSLSHSGDERGKFPWRPVLWLVPVVLLLVPALGSWPWETSDYVFAAVLFGTVGIAIDVIVRRSRHLGYRAGAVFAIVGAFLTVWVNGAVGMIRSEDNPYNLLFLGVPVIALAGAIVARFRAGGMALAMLVAALAQAGLGANGLASDMRGGIFSMVFSCIWLLSAALFFSASKAGAERG